ncbi:MAG TPA: glycoside hydrolase family 2 TIM barrel-domain containing protein, partial [Roseimicrobium sp.]|nr:glycoside hydrolase family 2 TIM barrel-domain containing protein [Roseimicrobium sp.]
MKVVRFLLIIFALLLKWEPAGAAPVPVRIEKTADGFRLLRDGKPYYIQGAGGKSYLDQLKKAGGNSVRTWGAEDLPVVIPQAEKLGLTVTAGLWMGHERHGFSYFDREAVQRQLEKFRREVEKYRDSEAMLMWGVGNEVEGMGVNAQVWRSINEVAVMIKRLDTNHPVMTVLSDITPLKIKALKAYCPDVDLIGINSYGGLATLAERLEQSGWTEKPYIVSEFGNKGPWESSRVMWNVARELSSSQKADYFADQYQQFISSQRPRCLGSYVFYWGWKQEYTGTWHGMFSKEGERLQTVDAMSFAWTGSWPTNRAPVVEGIDCAAAGMVVAPGMRIVARVNATDPDGDPLKYRWMVQYESRDKRRGGDAEGVPPEYPGALVENKGELVLVKTPTKEGAFRLVVHVTDG